MSQRVTSCLDHSLGSGGEERGGERGRGKREGEGRGGGEGTSERREKGQTISIRISFPF